jgi:hypothetical protein
MEPKLADAKTSLTLNAMNLPIETALTKTKRSQTHSAKFKARSRSAKFASQVADKSVASRELRRDRRADRGRRFGLFGRRFASRGATW